MYVIEQYRNCELNYWAGAGSRRESIWTKKFDAAVKFADYESGMRVLTDLCDGLGRVVEHAMVKAA
jgi:Na+-transporting NADH:ubiquinone oxidoreductase subunit NqrF